MKIRIRYTKTTRCETAVIFSFFNFNAFIASDESGNDQLTTGAGMRWGVMVGI